MRASELSIKTTLNLSHYRAIHSLGPKSRSLERRSSCVFRGDQPVHDQLEVIMPKAS